MYRVEEKFYHRTKKFADKQSFSSMLVLIMKNLDLNRADNAKKINNIKTKIILDKTLRLENNNTLIIITDWASKKEYENYVNDIKYPHENFLDIIQRNDMMYSITFWRQVDFS